MDAGSDFYVGYAPQAPPALAQRVRHVVVLLLLLVVVVAALLASLQADFDPAHFEYLEYRSFAGTLVSRPYPTLLVERPGERPPATEPTSRYLLVQVGKRGAPALAARYDRTRVELEGALIYGDGWTMVELREGSLGKTGGEPERESGAVVSSSPVTLEGEIVDSKCYLGVMKPGRGKPHRACGVRCVSGGIPPLLLVETMDGERLPLLLVDPAGGPANDRILRFIGDTVQLAGRIERWGDQWLFRAELESLRRR